MAYTAPRFGSLFLAACLLLLVLPAPVAAFGAGNIPSIAQVEGKNFRHGGTAYPGFDVALRILISVQILRICSRPLPSLRATNGQL